MGAEIPTEPLIFMKPMACLNSTGQIDLPSFSENIHHELELAIKLGDDLKPKSVALALDLTARDVQTAAKQKGHPWAKAKAFKDSCPISHWIDYVDDTWFETLEFQLETNGEIKQRGLTEDMLFKPQALIETIQNYFPLSSGDIILTGTPAGVGPLNSGDEVTAQINGLLDWSLKVN